MSLTDNPIKSNYLDIPYFEKNWNSLVCFVQRYPVLTFFWSVHTIYAMEVDQIEDKHYGVRYDLSVEGPWLSYRGLPVAVTGLNLRKSQVRIAPLILLDLAKGSKDKTIHSMMSGLAEDIRDYLGFWGSELWVPIEDLEEY